MELLWPALQRLDTRLSLDGLSWQAPHNAALNREAGVLVALSDEAQPRVLLGRRAMHLRHHPGEIAFPGGKRELEDVSPWVTAKREAMEEVGLPDKHIRPLGELSPLITRTGFEVHPCVACVPVDLEFVVEREEFDSVFTRPLELFADRELFRLEPMQVNGRRAMVPHYQVEDDNIWGVTAAVLALLANVAYDAGLDLQRDWDEQP